MFLIPYCYCSFDSNNLGELLIACAPAHPDFRQALSRLLTSAGFLFWLLGATIAGHHAICIDILHPCKSRLVGPSTGVSTQESLILCALYNLLAFPGTLTVPYSRANAARTVPLQLLLPLGAMLCCFLPCPTLTLILPDILRPITLLITYLH